MIRQLYKTVVLDQGTNFHLLFLNTHRMKQSMLMYSCAFPRIFTNHGSVTIPWMTLQVCKVWPGNKPMETRLLLLLLALFVQLLLLILTASTMSSSSSSSRSSTARSSSSSGRGSGCHYYYYYYCYLPGSLLYSKFQSPLQTYFSSQRMPCNSF